MDEAELEQRIEAAYEAFGRGDFEVATELFAEDFELVRPGDLGVIRGREAAREFYEPDALVDMRFALDAIEAHGDVALVSSVVSARGRYSGVALTQQSFHVWWLRDEQVIRGETFTEEAEARAAAGFD